MFYFLPLDSFRHLVFDLLSLLLILIFVEVVISYLIAYGGKLSPYHPFVKAVRSIVNPVVNPIRRILPHPSRTLNLDLSAMIAMILVQVVRSMFV